MLERRRSFAATSSFLEMKQTLWACTAFKVAGSSPYGHAVVANTSVCIFHTLVLHDLPKRYGRPIKHHLVLVAGELEFQSPPWLV